MRDYDILPLVDKWLAEAKEIRERADEEEIPMLRHSLELTAMIYEEHAEELQTETVRYWEELLSLKEAADESGYAYSTLQKKVARGEIPNSGSAGKPLVRRKYLPRKGGPIE